MRNEFKVKARSLSLKLTSIFIGLLVVFFMLEIGFRLFYFGLDAFSPQKINGFRTIGNTDYIQPSTNQKVLYELKPNLDVFFKLAAVYTNSQGMRDQEYPFKKPDSTFRIALIGDSFTFGDGIPIDSTYHSLVEDSINRIVGGRRYELINFGVGGYNLLNYRGVIEQKILAWRPDLIIIGYCGNNDNEYPHAYHWNKPYEMKTWKRILHYSQVVRMANEYGKVFKRKVRTSLAKTHREIVYVENSFAEFGRLSKENNIPILVFYLTAQDDVASNRDWVSRLSDANHLCFLDTSSKIWQIPNIEAYWIHSTDHHPNAAIHRMFATILQDYLMKYEQAPGCPEEELVAKKY